MGHYQTCIMWQKDLKKSPKNGTAYWSEGRDAALDVTVVSPLQATLLSKAAEEAGHAPKHA